MPDPTSSARKRYYARFPLRRPAYAVARRAGRYIEDQAARHFHGRLLEIGCGAKHKRWLVGHLVDEHVGLDHPDCPHDHSQIDLFGTAYEIPVPDDSFDCVLSTAVFEHLEEPAAAVREAYRVLRPGGVGLFTAPLFWHLHEEPRDFFRYTSYGLRHLFGSGGFDVLDLRPLGGFWLTASAAHGYYVQRFRRIRPLAWLVDAYVMALHLLPLLDRGWLRDERFTWMYGLVVQKPQATAATTRVEKGD